MQHVLERTASISTPFGALDATEFGDAANGMVLCVQGKSANLDVVTEWTHTARRLAAKGLHVIVPNLHSNAATKPGLQSFDELKQVLDAVVAHYRVESMVLCGKSWGGAQATLFAAACPQLVSRLVLVAPSIRSAEDHPAARLRGTPVLLFWASDDEVVPATHAQLYVERIQPSLLTFVTVPSGGHRILDEYAETIVPFCTASTGAPPPLTPPSYHLLVGTTVKVVGVKACPLTLT
jgi:pimeloyl-ACP methyl ester carboxylesterase